MTTLPSGTVTFLFTDIEGSTRLLHELGDAYASALAEHRRVLREAFVRHGGVEVDTQGDAFFVAFARASDALPAAREAQAALEGPVRVRIGVHTGEPLVTNEGYVGVDVHRAARIAAAGHGGQVLVSQSTRDLTGSDGLRDLGEHRLKDLTAPERIYQFGEGEFPPLKSLHQTNLPVQPTPLIGRDEDLTQVVELVRSHRLVTLTGAGGSGKTRLALQAAAELVDDFADGVWFVSLGALTDVALVEPTIASVVGATGEFADFLHDKRLLLVLDNLEQLLPDVASIVARLDTEVLATSRERLSVYGEREYQVPTLPVDEAVALFTERARLLKQAFEPDEHTNGIVRSLDGLPLAIELAAARVKALTTAQILERLGRNLDLLTTGSRDLPERQRTLRATIDWSYELLSIEEKELFAHLGVFAGSFELEAAEQIIKADVDGLSSLIDKSLVRQTEEGRFFLLETIRAFALDLFEGSPDEPAIRRHHARYQLDRSLSALEEEGHVFRDRLEPTYADLRAALIWLRNSGDNASLLRLASRLGRFWDYSGYLAEGRQWLETAVSLGPLDEVHDRGWALARLAHIAWRQGDYLRASLALEEAEGIALELDDKRLLADVFAYRGGVEIALNDLDAAASAYEEAIRVARACGDLRLIAVTVHDLGLISLQKGDYKRARHYVSESLSLCRDGGYDAFAGGAVATLGYIEFRDGNIDEAQRLLKAGLRSELERGTLTLSTAHDLYVFAAVAAQRGRFEATANLVGACDACFERSGARRETISNDARADALSTCINGIGETAVTQFLREGSALTLADAVEYALDLD